jgi:uncharacterized protein YggU (UPF0235/DUF167 family)
MRDGLRVAVRLQPGARANAVGGLTKLASGAVALKARVTAAPEGGKANAALIALLAKAWCVPKGSIEITGGRSDRNKVLHVAGDPADLKARLERWLAETGSRADL